MDKDEIRRRVRARKSLLTDTERRAEADSVFEMLENLAAFVMADNVLMYHSLPDELPTRDFLDKWRTRKHMFLPRVNGPDLDILPYERTRMHLGAFHIEEPDGDDTTDISDIDLIVVPAVAYSSSGGRIGRGRGYYDRLLSRARGVKVGVAFDFQLFDDDDFEAEAHDVPVDYVLTAHGIIRITHR